LTVRLLAALTRLLPLVIAASGCPAAPPAGPLIPPPGDGSEAAQEVVQPALTPLAHSYGERLPARLEGLEAQTYARLVAVAARLGQRPPVVDRASQAMAREVCAGLLPEGPPPFKLVTFALHGHGLVEPPPHFLVQDLPDGMEASALQSLDRQLERVLSRRRFSRVGISVTRPRATPKRRRLLLALLESRVALRKPMPRKLSRGQEARLVVALAPSISEPHLVVAGPAGSIRQAPLPESGTANILCRFSGIYQVELTGKGAHGVEVLANFPIYCDQDPPSRVRYGGVPALGKVGAMERQFHARANDVRKAAGLPPLAHSAALAEVARAHSADMHDHGFVGHVSPSTGQPSDRLRRARINFLEARENVARGYSVEEVLASLMSSPAHRANLLSDSVSQSGVGIVIDRSTTIPVLLVTQVLVKPGTDFDPGTAGADALALISRLRRRAGVPPLSPDPALQDLAARHVGQATAAVSRAAARAATRRLNRGLDALGKRYREVVTLQLQLSALESMRQARSFVERRFTHLGLAIGRLADGSMLVTVLLAVSR
jgi:uncharacterized protein YkwD